MNDAISSEAKDLKDVVRWNLLQRKTQEQRALQAFALFRKQGIEPILIKGLAAARYYPETQSRFSLDMDLAVAASDYYKATLVAEDPSANGLAIDLHRELRHLDSVEWNDLFKNSQLLEFDGGNIRVLRPEDHLRVLAVHWLNDGGSYKERLWDVYYMVKNRSSDFDWDRFLNSVSLRRRRWLICTIGLASCYLGLDLEETPIKDEARNIPSWLTHTVEREWKSDMPLLPLHANLHNRTILLGQIGKRMWPNPITATIMMEGSFDAKIQGFYRIGNILQRIGPSFRRTWKLIKR
ncbi:MAG: nucleotidyltransferase family protein [Pyrinomonadaceae bacterium]